MTRPAERDSTKHKADRETAYALCRTTYEGDCRCERNRAEPCVPMAREVEAMSGYLAGMRAAFAGHYPEDAQ